MSDTALVKRPVGDDLAVKVKAFRDEQLTEREKRAAPLKRKVLIESFLRLAERYFGVTREFVKNLSKDEGAELLKKVFEEAKLRLMVPSPMWHAIFAVTIIGIPAIFSMHNDRKFSFPAFKIRRLYKWYIENYGADDLEKAMKSGDFDKKTGANIPVKTDIDFLMAKPEPYEIVLPALAEGVFEASEKAAESIDFNPAMLLEIQLSKFLKDRSVRIFKYGDVKKYLYSLAKESDEGWYWRALREKDIREQWQYSGDYDSNRYRYHGYYSSKNFNCRPYNKLIPPRVRILVEEIVKEFGDKVRFLVSCHSNQSSGHFIAADAFDMGMIIFDSWHDDELKQPSE